jgi:hypothetical protein
VEVKQKLKNHAKRILGFFPQRLPDGMTAFKNWGEDILEIYGLPNEADYMHALATMIMHLGPTIHRKPPFYFFRSIKKTQANQIAYAVIQAIKEEKRQQKELQEVGVPSDQPIQDAQVS